MKSQIYKIGKYDENLTCVISLWRGRYASSRAIESIRLYIRAKGLERADIRYTDHVAFTNKEYELWFGRPVPGNSESSGQATSNVANQPAAIENAAEAEKNEEIKREDPENSEKAEGEKDSDSNAPTASVVSINHPVELTSGNGGVSGTEAQSLQPPAINEIPPTNREESSGEK
ncbi:hypothetical protein WR25_04203 [Diploscapter pachys]|uniref:Uncharacterized protein n=1 Tax=Diploscapter pachys TaxID=2018661 RepID=A0A2A2K176_9BILA|nr:hypothetical protein WR25_04203 [Diploscapter pachys]